MIDGNNFDWGHYLETFTGTVTACVGLFIAIWRGHQKDKKEREAARANESNAILAAAAKNELKNEERHRENTRLIGGVAGTVKDMATTLRYHPPHVHIEESGPLTAEGIWPKKRD